MAADGLVLIFVQLEEVETSSFSFIQLTSQASLDMYHRLYYLLTNIETQT